MAITFCDVPLLLHDPAGTLAGFVDAYLAEHQAQWFGRRPATEESLEQISRQRHPARVPMPQFNWPDRPRPRINTLYIPVTGATRWAVGLFLVDVKRYAKILAKLEADSSGTLAITDSRSGGHGKQTTRKATMYALTPRAIGRDLLVLPLVDLRYFWQYKDLGAWKPTNGSTTWTQLLARISSQAGTTIDVTTAIENQYGRPDPLEFCRTGQSLSQLIDAVAASTGRRLLCDLFAPGGTYGLHAPSDAETSAKNIESAKANYDLVAGSRSNDHLLPDNASHNTCQGETPDQVSVLFPEHWGKLPGGSGGYYTKTVTAAQAGASGTADQQGTTTWSIGSTAAADLNGYDPGHTPNNQDDLDDLAEQLAGSFYGWLKRSYDFSVAGLWGFGPTAYEDYHWIRLDNTTQTRVATLPSDVGWTTNWCQIGIPGGDTDTNERRNELWPGPRLRVMLKGDLTPGDSVECYPFVYDGTELSVPGGLATPKDKTITVYDRNGILRALGLDTIGDTIGGAIGEAEWKPDIARWEFVSLQCLAQICTAVTTGPASGPTFEVDNVVPWDDGQSPTSDTADTLSIVNWCGWTCSNAGVSVLITRAGAEWNFLQGPCGA